MNSKPETEAQAIERMLQYWFGGNSPAGLGRVSAGGSESNALSPVNTHESEKISNPHPGTEFLDETPNGISNLPQMKGLSSQLSKPARSISSEVQDSIFDAFEVH
jgi:hypothetical protein